MEKFVPFPLDRWLLSSYTCFVTGYESGNGIDFVTVLATECNEKPYLIPLEPSILGGHLSGAV